MQINLPPFPPRSRSGGGRSELHTRNHLNFVVAVVVVVVDLLSKRHEAATTYTRSFVRISSFWVSSTTTVEQRVVHMKRNFASRAYDETHVKCCPCAENRRFSARGNVVAA